MTSPRSMLDPAGQSRLLLWAVAIGVLAGIVAALFRLVATILPGLIWPAANDLASAVAAAPAWQRVAIPAAGALLAGLILTRGARWLGPARGWDILEAVVLRDGVLHLRPALVKSAASLCTVASAGAIGREGPMVLISATVSSLAGRWLGVPPRQLRILVGCGVAAGIAVAYNTPIGAALFTMEIIVGNFAMEVFAPLVFASVVATLIARAFFGGNPMFDASTIALTNPWEIAPVLLLGVLGGATAALFLQALRTSSYVFRKSRLPRPLAMCTVSLLLGAAILRYPEVVGNGREAIQSLLRENWGVGFSVSLLVLRLLLTSATVGSGAVGGVFTPTLFLGALLGDALGGAAHALAPGTIGDPKAYALVGMCALLAGTTHAPLTAVLMIFEMTRDYGLVLPFLLAAAAASLVARQLSRESVYTEALQRKRGAAGESAEAALMTTLKVRDVMRTEQATIQSDLPLPQVLDRFIAARRNHLYVVDPDGRLEGVVSLQDANRSLRESADLPSVLARDLTSTRFETTTPSERLDRVLEKFWVEETERLPVLEDGGSRRLVGTISKRDILGVYAVEVLHRRSLLARFDRTGPGDAEPTYVELPADHEVGEVAVPTAVVGRSIAEVRFRERFGVSVLMIRRSDPSGKETRTIPAAGTVLLPGDRLIVFGSKDGLLALREATLPRGSAAAQGEPPNLESED